MQVIPLFYGSSWIRSSCFLFLLCFFFEPFTSYYVQYRQKKWGQKVWFLFDLYDEMSESLMSIVPCVRYWSRNTPVSSSVCMIDLFESIFLHIKYWFVDKKVYTVLVFDNWLFGYGPLLAQSLKREFRCWCTNCLVGALLW